MELLTLKITPLSHFATLPKGDTIFGQILAYLFLENNISFDDYLTKAPKLVVSDMMPYGYVYKPNLPLNCFQADSHTEVEKKVLRKRKFISLKNLQNGDLHLCEQIDFMDDLVRIKNTIHRVSFTTDGADFASYGVEETAFHKEMWMFILVESSIKEQVLDTLVKIGKYGFGKNASTGKGAFEVEVVDERVEEVDSPYVLSLSPTILGDANIEKSWYEPFTRFGKFGLQHAHANPFKRPVLMAQSGAVVKLEHKAAYFGVCVDNGFVSKPSFLQGYSIAIPFKIKDEKCLSIK